MTTTKLKTTTPKPKSTSKATQAQSLHEQKQQDKLEDQRCAAMHANSNAANNLAVMMTYGQKMFEGLEPNTLYSELTDSIEQVQSGNLKELESMLFGQAKALQTMFVSLARRANGFEQLKQYQAFMNMALKAQVQSRSTIEALTTLKYPKQVIVTQQANISNGHQQVNNRVANDGNYQTNTRTHAHTHAEENQIEQNELKEINYDNTQNHTKSITDQTQQQGLDTRTAQSTSRANPATETMGILNGRKDR